MKKYIIATSLGAIAGFSYYYFIGCNSGSCPITSNPFISTGWGALMGLFFVSPSCCKKTNKPKDATQ